MTEPTPSGPTYFVDDGLRRRSFSLDALRSSIAQGLVSPQMKVWRQGLPGFVPASEVPELRGMFPSIETDAAPSSGPAEGRVETTGDAAPAISDGEPAAVGSLVATDGGTPADADEDDEEPSEESGGGSRRRRRRRRHRHKRDNGPLVARLLQVGPELAVALVALVLIAIGVWYMLHRMDPPPSGGVTIIQ